ncbi:MAG: UvrB/UvrC motif-containing protein [Planctomycetia bacterium]
MQFRRQGLVGCPFDYVVFHDALVPLLDRVHRASHHTGKRPRRSRRTVERPTGIGPLRRQLRQAIAADEFEKAARLRDAIREKDAEHGPA